MQTRQKRLRTPWWIPILLVAAASIPVSLGASELVFKVEDPFGDDFGDGRMEYPLRSDMERGDLDLLEFSAKQGEDGTWFRVVFARPIREPGREAADPFGTPRASRARHDFYTFNIDLYIDTDRQPGSGQVSMLPGRQAEVAAPYAWEKVVALTPRPEVLRASLHRLRVREWHDQESRKRSVSRSEVRQRKRQIAEELMPIIYFPNHTRVVGRRIDFFVPRAFLNGEARDDWGYVLVVTGAVLEQRFSIPFLSKWSQEYSDGLLMPVVPGRDQNAFGGGLRFEPLQPPLIDILVPPGDQQERILASFDSYQEQRAQIPGIVPAEY